MPYLIVFIVAAAAGLAVYLVTLRADPQADSTVRAGVPAGAPTGAPGPGYLPIAATRTDWQTRLTGFLGLIVAIVLAAVFLATTLYVSFSTLVRLIGNAAPSGVASS
jgi:hypothetical protein